MKNLKRPLALLLLMAALFGMSTLSDAKAAGYADADLIREERGEAVEVMSALGVFQGAGNKFDPEGILTREQAAKIISYMLLRKDEADKLVASVAPYNDVARDRWSAGSIEYCKSQGIISGLGEGRFDPAAQLTGLQFARMLLSALGYDAASEKLVGAEWGINTSKLAISEAKITDGVESKTLEGPLSRQDACQLAYNTLTANVQEYQFKHESFSTRHINVVNKDGDYRAEGGDEILQFCEKYFPRLERYETRDVFGRPAFEWLYEGKQIGLYVRDDLLVREWTEKVTGAMLYDLFGSDILAKAEFRIYVDGETRQDVLDGAFFTAAGMTSGNKEAVGGTGRGVLTQVFHERMTDKVTIAIINTYLAKSEKDYDDKSEDVELTVYSLRNNQGALIKEEGRATVVSTDRAGVEAIKRDEFFLVRIAGGVIQSMEKPTLLEKQTVSEFRLGEFISSGGKQYDFADTLMYDAEVLNAYDQENMKEAAYNLILDRYGFLIGIEETASPDAYLFLTMLDDNNSNLSGKSADARVITMDGKLESVSVNLEESVFQPETLNADGAFRRSGVQLNTWCNFKRGSDGTYILTEVPVSVRTDRTAGAVKVAQHWQDVGDALERDPGGLTKKINAKHLSLSACNDGRTATLVYGNDQSVYINTTLENESGDGGKYRVIDSVKGRSVGVKAANLTMMNLEKSGDYEAPDYEIYTLYGDDGYVIAAVTIGVAESTTNFAFVHSDDISTEGDAGGTQWIWGREVLLDGELSTLNEKGTKLRCLGSETMEQGAWYEVKLNTSGNVASIQPMKVRLSNADKTDDFIDKVADVPAAVAAKDTVVLADTTTVTRLRLVDGMLTTAESSAIPVSSEVKTAVVLAKTGSDFETVKDGFDGYSGLESALGTLNAANLQSLTAGSVELHAVFEDGVATSIILHDRNV